MAAKHDENHTVARIAAAIGDPARARMLYCLLDGHARTSTELSAVAEVTPSTASLHLARLKTDGLVTVLAQGKHRYYSLRGPEVAAVLEGLSVLAGGVRKSFVPNTPPRLRAARTCYDHIAGSLGILLHDRIRALGWVVGEANEDDTTYTLTEKGHLALKAIGLDLSSGLPGRRRLAFGCLDWSERRCHLGGSLGAELLRLARRRKWVVGDLEGRALSVTVFGRREMAHYFGVSLPADTARLARTSG